MKIEKNKIVFALVILCVVLFIGAYSVMMLGDDEEPIIENNQIPVPELEENQKSYKSKLEALDDLKEVRQNNAPSIYDERLLDSTGIYDPNLLEKEKMRIVDSIYRHGRIDYTDRSYRKAKVNVQSIITKKDTTSSTQEKEIQIMPKELGLEHELFFASSPLENENVVSRNTDSFIHVRVDGTQIVRNNYRLQMRLTKDAIINGVSVPKNTPIYGFVSLNRIEPL